MAEERTVSNFTKLNSPDRANQKVSTLVHMRQVRQHYRRQRATDIPSESPKLIIPKRRDLSDLVKQADVGLDLDHPAQGPEDKPATPSATEGSANNPIELSDGPGTVSNTADVEEAPTSGPITDPVEIAEHLAWAEHERHRKFRPDGGEEVQGKGFDLAHDGVDLSSPALRNVLSDAPIPGAEAVLAGESTKRKGDGSGKELFKKPKLIEGLILMSDPPSERPPQRPLPIGRGCWGGRSEGVAH